MPFGLSLSLSNEVNCDSSAAAAAAVVPPPSLFPIDLFIPSKFVHSPIRFSVDFQCSGGGGGHLSTFIYILPYLICRGIGMDTERERERSLIRTGKSSTSFTVTMASTSPLPRPWYIVRHAQFAVLQILQQTSPAGPQSALRSLPA